MADRRAAEAKAHLLQCAGLCQSGRRLARQAIMVGQTDSAAPFAAPQVVFNQDSVIGLGGDPERTPVTMKETSLKGISLIRHNKGGPLNNVIAGDTLWIAFMGEPTGGSVPNPRVPGQPLLFRETMDLWALRADIEETEDGELHLNDSGPLPIVQLGDTCLGNPILEITMSDSLVRGTKDGDGVPRVPKKNDHVVAFRVRTINQLALLLAIHFDGYYVGPANSTPTEMMTAGTQPLANGYYRADWQLPEHRPAMVNGSRWQPRTSRRFPPSMQARWSG